MVAVVVLVLLLIVAGVILAVVLEVLVDQVLHLLEARVVVVHEVVQDQLVQFM
jgi:hypothetical protein